MAVSRLVFEILPTCVLAPRTNFATSDPTDFQHELNVPISVAELKLCVVLKLKYRNTV